MVERRRKRRSERKVLKKCIPRRPCPTTSELKARGLQGSRVQRHRKKTEERERSKETKVEKEINDPCNFLSRQSVEEEQSRFKMVCERD